MQTLLIKFFKILLDFLGYMNYIIYRATERGENVSPRTGRPKSENPKSNPIHVRLDDETMDILENYCNQENVPKTEGIRRGIQELKSKIKKD